MKARILAGPSIALGIGLGAALMFSHAGAQEKKEGPNTTKPSPDKVKSDEKCKAVAQLGMAYNLIIYGRENKSPEALILAAKILGSTPTKRDDRKLKQEQGEKVQGEAADPAKLLAEAKEMTEDKNIEALADSVGKQLASEGSRGSLSGPGFCQGGVGPNSVAIWSGVFIGGQPAAVNVSSFNGADLDLYVYDERGNLITQDSSPYPSPACFWGPFWTGPFTLRIVNSSPFGTGFQLNHN